MQTRVFRVTVTLLTLIFLWELIPRVGAAPEYLLPPFTKVVYTLYTLTTNGVLIAEYIKTLVRVLTGFTLGVPTGLLIGLSVAFSPGFRDSFLPVLAFLAVIPVIALVPLLMIWVGMGEALPITAVLLCSSIPVAYNTASGVRSVDPEIIYVAKTLGAHGLKLATNILVPQSLPNLFSAMKIEAAMAWKTCFVTEMIAMSSGLGYFMLMAYSLLRVDMLLAALMVLVASTYIFHWSIDEFERSLLRKWGVFNDRGRT